ncbi:hypothetical protein B0O80DRAFT_442760 [Mortierella sp. GBAus27b]|nr:hypothetical protein B0O80DRAFT_442760 [Mortierella sp. GBAus27b]
MLKFGVTVTGVAIPAATLLVLTEALDRATSSLKMLQEKIKSTYILDVGLYWDSTSQLSQAAGYPCAIQRQCTEAHVNLNLNGDHNSRHDSLFDLMRHPSTQSVVILGPPKDFFQGSKLLSQNEGFLNLRHLEIDISSMKEDIQASKD